MSSSEFSNSPLWTLPDVAAARVQQLISSELPLFRERLDSARNTHHEMQKNANAALAKANSDLAAQKTIENRRLQEIETESLKTAEAQSQRDEARTKHGTSAAESRCSKQVEQLKDLESKFERYCTQVEGLPQISKHLKNESRCSTGLPPSNVQSIGTVAMADSFIAMLVESEKCCERESRNLVNQMPRLMSWFPGTVDDMPLIMWGVWLLVSTGFAAGLVPDNFINANASWSFFWIIFTAIFVVPGLISIMLRRWMLERSLLLLREARNGREEAIAACKAAQNELERILQPIRATLAEIQERHRIAVAAAKEMTAKEKLSAEQRSNQEQTHAVEVHQRSLAACDQTLGETLDKLKSEFADFMKIERANWALLCERLGAGCLPWGDSGWDNLSAATTQDFAVQFGELTLDVEGIVCGEDAEAKTHLTSLPITLPALAPFNSSKPLIFLVHGEKSRKQAIAAMQSSALRILSALPPGQAKLVFVDPLARGDNGAPFALLDTDGVKLVTRPHTEAQAIESALVELTNHIETVKWQFLHGDHHSIMDHNLANPGMAEAFRVLLVFDFPVNFNPQTVERLLSVASSGARCGILTLMLCDATRNLPHGVKWEQIERIGTVIDCTDGAEPQLKEAPYKPMALALDTVPLRPRFEAVLKAAVQGSKTTAAQPVPFSRILTLPDLEGNPWQKNSTAKDITVPLGPRGGREIQSFTLGVDGTTAHHALLIGQTGSGKTNLMHVLITTLALKYSPKELRLYLLDMKGGVGFKRYAEHRLAHARVIAIETDREFGWSVLKGLDAELKNRENNFRKTQADSIAAYRQKTGDNEAMPRLLLVADEFQELFSEEDMISSDTKTIIERLVRQGRQFGIHLLLSTQSLSSRGRLLSDAVMDQMNVRICLKASTTDSSTMLGHNGASFLPDKGGWGIYKIGANPNEPGERFRGALMDEADWTRSLIEITDRGHSLGISSRDQNIFEGGELSHLDTHRMLDTIVRIDKTMPARFKLDAWLGDPIEDKPACIARFVREAGSHMLIVARDEDAAVGMMTSALITMLRQAPPETVTVRFLDFANPDSEWADIGATVADAFPDQIKLLPKLRAGQAILDVANIVHQRMSDGQAAFPEVFLVIQGVQRVRELRGADAAPQINPALAGLKPQSAEQTMSPAAALATILREGPDVGVHLIASCDTVPNTLRAFGPKALADIGMRVATEMNADDSRKLLDNDTSASRFGKPHRAVFMNLVRGGDPEKFRPFRIPPADWIATKAANTQPSESTP